MGVDVSIIIVNYHTIDLIKDCINSIRNHTSGLTYEVIVVDNASEDISSLSCADIKTMQLEENLGFGGANNKGVEIAKGEFLFLLNPDTILLNNAIKILHEAMNAIPDCGITGGNLYDAQLQPMHSYYYCTMSMRYVSKCLFKSAGKLYDLKNQHNFGTSPRRVEFITGADLMIRKSVFEEVGKFNPEIFMYYEDVDLCKRVRKRGLKCYSIPEAKIQHLEGQSFKPDKNNLEEIRLRKRKMSGHSISVFLKNNYSRFHYMSIINSHILIQRLKKLITNSSGAKEQLDYYRLIKAKL